MASAARQANFIEENVQYADDIKPSLQHRFQPPQLSLSCVLSPVTVGRSTEPSPVKYEAVAPAHQAEQENSAVEYEPHHIIPPNKSAACHPIYRIISLSTSTPIPSATTTLVNPRPEHPQSAWLYQPTCEQNRSPPAEVFYERERGALPHCLRLNHRSSSHAHRLSGPYATYTPEYGYPAVSDYHTLDEFGYNECRPNPRRILYPQAIYPGNGASPYSRPMAHSAMPAERPFLCEKCGARFNRNHDLKRHTRIHLEVKPFPCGWCEKAFSRKDALKRHLMVKACSGSKEVSVEESIRRAEQVRQRKFESPSPSSATST
ncbi:hypothetical protein H4Q26_009723 [Puccinia striiformis f. sp. tritici PST-130]|nr:hypothetical protein H4Q26_009723 [Puccinia striiformis f. sp. tritici PST-130]